MGLSTLRTPNRPGLLNRLALPLIRKLRTSYEEYQRETLSLPSFSLALPDGAEYAFGRREPIFRVKVHDQQTLVALTSLDETRFCEAYMAGTLDVEGEFGAIFDLRPLLSDTHPLQSVWFKVLHPLLLGQIASDKKWIAEHYDEEADFFLQFLDRRRCYSHGLFEHDHQSLEEAIENKLSFALHSVGAKAGQKVLDIGSGWGTMVEYGAENGLEVTSLTISEASRAYVAEQIAKKGWPCKIIHQHFLEYQNSERFDAILNLGVTEHLPDYRATLKQYQTLLKPGGRVYLDACGARRKFPFSSFIYRYIFPGNASPLCLHEYLAEVARTPFEVVAVYNDRSSYELTCRHWAERLEANRNDIIRRWGKSLFRRFQLYLWGCVDVFQRGECEAYRLVLELPDRPVRKKRWTA